MSRIATKVVVFIVALAVVASACGDDTSTIIDGAVTGLDINGDGKVLIGLATNGPRDDGGYYQALVDGVVEIAAENDLAAPIIVDLIDPARAEEELRNLAEQGVDILVVGSSAVAEPLPTLLAEFPEILWYCNCGSNYPVTAGVLISRDRGAELWISGGYAAGLLLQERGGDRAAFLGCCDLPFERESFAAFVHGLTLVDESFSAVYVPTGAFPFDFNNASAAVEAFNNALGEGVDAVAPFLGAGHDPVIGLASENDLVAIAAGASDACERTDIDADLVVRYDSGDYIKTIFAEIVSGVSTEGMARDFHVGVDEEVGAQFCGGASSEQEAMLAELNASIGAGTFDDVIAAIVAEAYGS